jgi:hypothetical protein
MAKMQQPRKGRTPENRATEIVLKQRKRVRRGFRENTKKRKRYPGEIQFKQDMGIILALAGYTHKEIALSLGESKNTVGEWMREPAVQEKFLEISEALPEAAKTLLETYQIEAVHAMVDVLRSSEDDKIILEAAREILDRGGNPKTSRTESKQSKHETFEISDDDFLSKLRMLPPEKQEEAAQMIEDLSEFLARNSSPTEGANSGETAETQNLGTDSQ